MKSGWKTVTLKEISKNIQYGYTASASGELVGPKFLRITDIVPALISWNSVPYCEIEKKDLEKYLLHDGDIVIARIEDEVTVKYFQRSAPNVVHLKPANEEFNDIEVNLEETELYIEGKSVGLIREN